MKGSKKKLIFKNKKKGKTYKNKFKKRKTYKKRRYKRKTLKKKFIGGININLSEHDDSPQNIHIIANIGGNIEDITGSIEAIFEEDGFDEDDHESPPPNFLQLQNAFIKYLRGRKAEIGLSRDQIDKIQIKIYTIDPKNALLRKLVYTTGQENKEGENVLEENTTYLILNKSDDEDKIKAIITDPVQGNMFGMTISNIRAQNARTRHPGVVGVRGIDWMGYDVADAEVLAQTQSIKHLDGRIQSLNKALAGLPKDNTRSREIVNSLLDNLKEKRILEVQKLTGNSPVISREPSSISTDEQRAEEIQPVPASLMGVVTPAEETEQAPNIEGNGPAEEKSDDRAAAEYEPEATPEQIRNWMYWNSLSEIPENPPPKEFIDLPEENVSRDKRRTEDNLGPATKKQKKDHKKDSKGGKKTRYRKKKPGKKRSVGL